MYDTVVSRLSQIVMILIRQAKEKVAAEKAAAERAAAERAAVERYVDVVVCMLFFICCDFMISYLFFTHFLHRATTPREARAPRVDMEREAAVKVEPRAPRVDMEARVAAARARADEEVDAKESLRLSTGQLQRILLQSPAFRKKRPS